MTLDECVKSLRRVNVPLRPEFIDFQLSYGGYSPNEDLTYGIAGPSDQPKLCRYHQESRTTTSEGLELARCDLDNRTQIRLHIDEHGKFYFEHTPVAESFESYVRFEAYRLQTLQSLGWTFIDQERRETKRVRAFFDNLEPSALIDEVTDRFHWVRRSSQFFETMICGVKNLFVCPQALPQS